MVEFHDFHRPGRKSLKLYLYFDIILSGRRTDTTRNLWARNRLIYTLRNWVSTILQNNWTTEGLVAVLDLQNCYSILTHYNMYVSWLTDTSSPLSSFILLYYVFIFSVVKTKLWINCKAVRFGCEFHKRFRARSTTCIDFSLLWRVLRNRRWKSSMKETFNYTVP